MSENCFCHFNGYEVKDAKARASVDILESAKPINVLLLGVKNDGSEDISSIVNEATRNYPLYFPAGKYLVSSPLVIVNGIYGATNSCGNAFHFDQAADHTTLISGIQYTGNPDTVIGDKQFVIVNTGTFNAVEGIVIECSSDEGGILDEGIGAFTIQNVAIKNVGRAYGIAINHSESRAAIMNNVSMYASDDLYWNGGIYFKAGTDNRISNITIMGFMTGIRIDNGLLYGDNIHIWCGKNSVDTITEEWWALTRGIDMYGTYGVQGAYGFFNNLYIDTARYIFGQESGTFVTVNNIISWNDGSIDHLETADGMLTNGGISYDRNRIRVNGGMIHAGNHHSRLFDYTNSNVINGVYINVPAGDNCMSDYYRYILPIPWYGYDDRYYCNSGALSGNYHEVARVFKGDNESIEFTFSNKTKSMVSISSDFTSVTRSGDSAMELYYKIEGDVMRIYSYDRWVFCKVSNHCVNYDFIIDETGSIFVRDSVTDVSEMTAIV